MRGARAQGWRAVTVRVQSLMHLTHVPCLMHMTMYGSHTPYPQQLWLKNCTGHTRYHKIPVILYSVLLHPRY